MQTLYAKLYIAWYGCKHMPAIAILCLCTFLTLPLSVQTESLHSHIAAHHSDLYKNATNDT